MLVTAAGYAQLYAEPEALRTVSRQEMSEQLRGVREDGDPDNPMLFDLLEIIQYFLLPPGAIAYFVVGIAIAAGVLAAILPARRASRLNVLETLQYE